MKLKNEVWQVNTTGISGVDAKTDIAMGTSEDGKPAIRIGENVVTGEGGGGSFYVTIKQYLDESDNTKFSYMAGSYDDFAEYLNLVTNGKPASLNCCVVDTTNSSRAHVANFCYATFSGVGSSIQAGFISGVNQLELVFLFNGTIREAE